MLDIVLTAFNELTHQHSTISTIIILIIRMGKVRNRGGLVRRNKASKWWDWDLDSGTFIPQQ